MTTRDRKRRRRVEYRIKGLERRLRDNSITLEEYVYKKDRLFMRWLADSLARVVAQQVIREAVA